MKSNCSISNLSERARHTATLLLVLVALHQATLWLGPLAWWLDVWTHFQLQYAITGLILTPIVFAISRSYVITLAWALYVAAACLWVVSTHSFTTTNLEHADLLFQNIRYDQSVRAHANLAAAIAAQSADVYAFAESSATFVRAFSETTDTEPAISHLDGGRSCAVFVATTSIDVLNADVWYTSKGDPMCMVALTNYDLYVAHPLPPLSQERFARTKSYLTLVRESIERSEALGRAWLVVGDFNSTRYSRVYRGAVGEYLSKQFYTWQTESILALPIDHAYSSHTLLLAQTPAYSSDHNGIAIKFIDRY